MTLKLMSSGEYLKTPLLAEAQNFAQEHGLDVTLEWKSGQWWLQSDSHQERPFSLELDQELARHEAYFKKSSIHKEILARSLGIKGGYRPVVLDLTAGLLGDTLLFLSFGCEVIALERNPIVALLIESALANSHHPALSRLRFFPEDAQSYLSQNQAPEVIFFDPMFEDPNLKVSPKKEMRIFRSLVGKDIDAQRVFDQALALNPKRLVIKRPKHSGVLGKAPDVVYTGKATRYDVYLSRNMASLSEIS